MICEKVRERFQNKQKASTLRADQTKRPQVDLGLGQLTTLVLGKSIYISVCGGGAA